MNGIATEGRWVQMKGRRWWSGRKRATVSQSGSLGNSISITAVADIWAKCLWHLLCYIVDVYCSSFCCCCCCFCIYCCYCYWCCCWCHGSRWRASCWIEPFRKNVIHYKVSHKTIVSTKWNRAFLWKCTLSVILVSEVIFSLAKLHTSGTWKWY